MGGERDGGGEGVMRKIKEEGRTTGGGGGAVIRIAHVGDCMGMLIRGDEIVWRSEEMWWGVSVFSFVRFLSVFLPLFFFPFEIRTTTDVHPSRTITPSSVQLPTPTRPRLTNRTLRRASI